MERTEPKYRATAVLYGGQQIGFDGTITECANWVETVIMANEEDITVRIRKLCEDGEHDQK